LIDSSSPSSRGRCSGSSTPNGARKTTTARLLLALERATAGTARVFGLDSSRERVVIHARSAYPPGEFELHPRMTGARVLDLFARDRGGVDNRLRDEPAERFDVTLDRQKSTARRFAPGRS
jgi:ABC-2 type transport system ATP-binding protein